MLVSELIQMLCDNPEDLLKDLKDKYTVLTKERDDVHLRMENLKKVIRIATDVKCRLARNEEEIGALHEALMFAETQGLHMGGLDLTNLYSLTDMPNNSNDTGY